MSKKKNKKQKNNSEVPVITAHDCKAENKSTSRERFEKRDSDRPNGTTGNYS